MKVKRIVSNIEATKLNRAKAFYHGIFGLEILMDQGWIQTFGSDSTMPMQINIATEGGSGTPVPDISIEVDDLDFALTAVKEAGHAIEYGPQTEPWGVRRFYVRDPFGKLINVMQHV